MWRFGVEGAHVRSRSVVEKIRAGQLDEPLVLSLDPSPEETVIVSGMLPPLEVHHAAGYRVIEQFWIEGRRRPLTMPAYPLSAAGEFGSVRRLAGVQAVRVSVLSPASRAATEFAKRGSDGPVFRLGQLRLRQPPHAELVFTAPNFGPVEPPIAVALEMQDVTRSDRFDLGAEEAARFRWTPGLLAIDNLRRGRYVLRWTTAADATEAFVLDVPNTFGGTLEATVERRALSEETIEVELVDSAGNAIGGSASDPAAPPRTRRRASRPAGYPIASPDGRGEGSRGDDDSLLRVPVQPRGRTRFSVRTPGFLAATVDVEPGAPIPRRLTLYRGVRARGVLLDSAGERAYGRLDVSWTPIAPSPIAYGEPMSTIVERGRFEVEELPPVPAYFTFRLQGSTVSITRRITLPEILDEAHDLGVLRLEETRTLSGVVRYADGEPAKNARVGLVDPDDVWNYPLRAPLDWSRVRYRAKTDVAGSFEIDVLPNDLDPEVALVAVLDGEGVAVEVPIDFSAESHGLVLDAPSVLELRVGYKREQAFEQWMFTLEYQGDEADPSTRRDLGEIPPDLWGYRRFEGVRPGRYAVTWRLRDAYVAIPPLVESVFVPEGGVGTLALVVEGEVLTGRARLNGEAVEKGWVLLTWDPGVNGGSRIGRIVDGRYTLIDPPQGTRAWAAVIPETKPQPLQNVLRGEAVPIAVAGYRSALRSARLDLDFRGRGLTVNFSAAFLTEHPDAVLHYDSYQWDGNRFRIEEGREAVHTRQVRFELLEPRIHSITVRNGRGSLLRRLSVSLIEKDVELKVR